MNFLYVFARGKKIGISSTIYSQAFFKKKNNLVSLILKKNKTKCKVKPQNYISLTSNFLKVSGTFV